MFTVALLQECAARNVQHKLLRQYMCGGLCISHLRNLASVGVRNSLARRNVQHRLLHQQASLQEMYIVGCCTSIRMWGYAFPAFVIQHMWVCTTTSLEEMYSIGSTNIRMWCAQQPRWKKCIA